MSKWNVKGIRPFPEGRPLHVERRSENWCAGVSIILHCNFVFKITGMRHAPHHTLMPFMKLDIIKVLNKQWPTTLCAIATVPTSYILY